MNIVLLFGGTSSEHDVSLYTGSFIYSVLRKKYNVQAILITKNGDWITPGHYNHPMPEIQLLNRANISSLYLEEFTKLTLPKYNKGISLHHVSPNIVFLGLHGGHGEDGTIQGLLDSYNIPYTGSGVLASALAMDKEKSSILFRSYGMNVADFIAVDQIHYERDAFLKSFSLKFPVFIKPKCGGSSVGTGIAKNIEELYSTVEKLFQVAENLFIQELITGVEVSCGVLEKPSGNRKVKRISLLPTEIVPKSSYFDYESKYTPGGSEEITPARISLDMIQSIQDSAVRAHSILGCKGYSRTDFIIQNGIPYILETNTLPGMTGTSLIPQQAKASGYEMEEVYDWLIEIANQK